MSTPPQSHCSTPQKPYISTSTAESSADGSHDQSSVPSPRNKGKYSLRSGYTSFSRLSSSEICKIVNLGDALCALWGLRMRPTGLGCGRAGRMWRQLRLPWLSWLLPGIYLGLSRLNKKARVVAATALVLASRLQKGGNGTVLVQNI